MKVARVAQSVQCLAGQPGDRGSIPGRGERILASVSRPTVLWSKTILHKTKILMYQALVQSILLYGAETWTLNTQQANILLATKIDFWRRSARKSRKEKVRNVTIRERS
jgi:hypothetical protein